MSEVEKKMCPHCGSMQFAAFIKRGGIVESNGVDANGRPLYTIIREGAKENYEVELFKCAKCQKEITEADLIGSIKCKKCGKMVSHKDLNDDGVCVVCSLLEANPAIGQMSIDDLRLMVARLAQQHNPVKDSVAAKTEKAEAIEKKAEEAAKSEAPAEQPVEATSDINDILGNDESAAPAATPAKPKRRTKATKKTAEQPQAEEAIADGQEAPFPDVADNMNPPEEALQEEQPATADGGNQFKMFDDDDTDQPF